MRFRNEGAKVTYCKGGQVGRIAMAAAKLMLDSISVSDEPRERGENAIEAGWHLSSNAKQGDKGEVQNSGNAGLIGEKQEASITYISAADRAEEVRVVAREVKRLILEEAYPLKEVTLVCRSLDLYAYHLQRVFEEFAIPIELDLQKPLAEHPLIVSLLSLLKLEAEHFQRRAVIETLRSPYFDFSTFGLHGASIEILDQLSFDERVIQTREQWIEALDHPIRKSDSELKTALPSTIEKPDRETIKEKLISFFADLSFDQSSTRKSYVQQILRLITKLKVEEKIDLGRKTPLDAKVLETFSEILNSLAYEHELEGMESAPELSLPPIQHARRLPGNVSTWSDFYQELANVVAVTSIPLPKQNTESILVQEVHNLRPRNYQVIFVIGLIEGEFPKKSKETTPYTLAEREMLRQLGLDFSETRNDAGADLTQFHKIMTHATDHLYLSHARSDRSGGELLRSYLIDEVRAVGIVKEFRHSQGDQANVEAAIRQVASLEELAIRSARNLLAQPATVDRLPAKVSGKQLSEFLTKHLRSWPATVRGAAVERRRLSGKEQGIFGGLIRDQILIKRIQSRYGEDFLWSATKLNDFGLCPFRFMAGDALNLKAADEPSVGFAPDRLGVAYHEILEKTFKTMKTRDLELNEATLEEAIHLSEDFCETVLQELLDKRQVRQSALWDFEKSEMKKRVANLLRAEIVLQEGQASQPILFEQRFGFGNQPPLEIDIDDGKIRIRGTIDRVDKHETGLAVIDYKTSRSPISTREAIEGRNLQLPIYLMAANRLLRLEEPVANGYYLHIYSCKKGSQFPNKNSSVEAITEKAEEFIKDYVSRIRRGEFPVQPNQNRCPPYCEYEVLCRIQSLGTQADEEG
jgi:ATP-dependent helicase/nuclease subunit B